MASDLNKAFVDSVKADLSISISGEIPPPS